MKTVICVTMVFCLAFCLSACGSAGAPVTSSQSTVAMPLSDCFTVSAEDQPITGHLEFIDTPSDYMTYLSIEALGDLTDLSFYQVDWTEETYRIGQTLYTAPAIGTGQIFVAGITFWGDLTTYGVSCTDSAGVRHHYAIYLSGKDGSVITTPFTP